MPADAPVKLPAQLAAIGQAGLDRARGLHQGRSASIERMPRTVVAISEPMAASETATMASATSTSIEGEAGLGAAAAQSVVTARTTSTPPVSQLTRT